MKYPQSSNSHVSSCAFDYLNFKIFRCQQYLHGIFIYFSVLKNMQLTLNDTNKPETLFKLSKYFKILNTRFLQLF